MSSPAASKSYARHEASITKHIQRQSRRAVWASPTPFGESFTKRFDSVEPPSPSQEQENCVPVEPTTTGLHSHSLLAEAVKTPLTNSKYLSRVSHIEGNLVPSSARKGGNPNYPKSQKLSSPAPANHGQSPAHTKARASVEALKSVRGTPSLFKLPFVGSPKLVVDRSKRDAQRKKKMQESDSTDTQGACSNSAISAHSVRPGTILLASQAALFEGDGTRSLRLLKLLQRDHDLLQLAKERREALSLPHTNSDEMRRLRAAHRATSSAQFAVIMSGAFEVIGEITAAYNTLVRAMNELAQPIAQVHEALTGLVARLIEGGKDVTSFEQFDKVERFLFDGSTEPQNDNETSKNVINDKVENVDAIEFQMNSDEKQLLDESLCALEESLDQMIAEESFQHSPSMSEKHRQYTADISKKINDVHRISTKTPLDCGPTPIAQSIRRMILEDSEGEDDQDMANKSIQKMNIKRCLDVSLSNVKELLTGSNYQLHDDEFAAFTKTEQVEFVPSPTKSLDAQKVSAEALQSSIEMKLKARAAIPLNPLLDVSGDTQGVALVRAVTNVRADADGYTETMKIPKEDIDERDSRNLIEEIEAGAFEPSIEEESSTGSSLARFLSPEKVQNKDQVAIKGKASGNSIIIQNSDCLQTKQSRRTKRQRSAPGKSKRDTDTNSINSSHDNIMVNTFVCDGDDSVNNSNISSPGSNSHYNPSEPGVSDQSSLESHVPSQNSDPALPQNAIAIAQKVLSTSNTHHNCSDTSTISFAIGADGIQIKDASTPSSTQTQVSSTQALCVNVACQLARQDGVLLSTHDELDVSLQNINDSEDCDVSMLDLEEIHSHNITNQVPNNNSLLGSSEFGDLPDLPLPTCIQGKNDNESALTATPFSSQMTTFSTPFANSACASATRSGRGSVCKQLWSQRPSQGRRKSEDFDSVKEFPVPSFDDDEADFQGLDNMTFGELDNSEDNDIDDDDEGTESRMMSKYQRAKALKRLIADLKRRGDEKLKSIADEHTKRQIVKWIPVLQARKFALSQRSLPSHSQDEGTDVLGDKKFIPNVPREAVMVGINDDIIMQIDWDEDNEADIIHSLRNLLFKATESTPKKNTKNQTIPSAGQLGGSVIVAECVPVSKKTKDILGHDFVVTPLRRSLRHLNLEPQSESRAQRVASTRKELASVITELDFPFAGSIGVAAEPEALGNTLRKQLRTVRQTENTDATKNVVSFENSSIASPVRTMKENVKTPHPNKKRQVTSPSNSPMSIRTPKVVRTTKSSTLADKKQDRTPKIRRKGIVATTSPVNVNRGSSSEYESKLPTLEEWLKTASAAQIVSCRLDSSIPPPMASPSVTRGQKRVKLAPQIMESSKRLNGTRYASSTPAKPRVKVTVK